MAFFTDKSCVDEIMCNILRPYTTRSETKNERTSTHRTDIIQQWDVVIVQCVFIRISRFHINYVTYRSVPS